MKMIKMPLACNVTFKELCDKPLTVTVYQTMANILNEFLKYRQHKGDDDFLFCNALDEKAIEFILIILSLKTNTL